MLKKVGDYLKCSSCGTHFENRSHFCPNCGKKVKKNHLIPILVIVALLCMSAFGFVLFHYFNPADFNQTTKTASVVDSSVVDDTEKTDTKKKQQETAVVTKPEEKPASEISETVQKDVTQVIDESLEKVVTIYTGTSQGSGFLINDQGDVLTNAHVVEGAIEVTVIDSENQKYSGTVIGYSNNTDVAIVRVAELAGKTPLTLETSEDALIGDEVIALGSPLGVRNTATLGYITGIDRSFFVGERSYDNVYQMSAHLSEGSSGGPLLSLNTGKVIAINSARLVEEDSVGFSIPIKSFYSLVSEWMVSPLPAEELNSLYYKENGNMYYQDEIENGEDVYFDGGDYSDEDSSYYEIPDEWYNVEEPNDEDDQDFKEQNDDESYYEDEYIDSVEENEASYELNHDLDNEVNDENYFNADEQDDDDLYVDEKLEYEEETNE